MDDDTFTITIAGYDLQFSGPRAVKAANSFMEQFRERADHFGQEAALSSVVNWCKTLPATSSESSYTEATKA